MKKDSRLIKVSCDSDGVDGAEVHIRNIGPTDHVTMCGLDGADEQLNQRILELKRGDKVNCNMCISFYENRKFLNMPRSWIKT